MKIFGWNLMFGDLDPRNQSALPRSKTSSVEKGSVPTWGRCTWSGLKTRDFTGIQKMEMQRWEVHKHVRKVEITKQVVCNTLPMAYGNNQTRLDWANGRNANLIQIERVWRNVGRWATRSVWSSRFVNGVYFLKAIFKHDAKVWKLTNTRGHSCRCEFTFLSKQI